MQKIALVTGGTGGIGEAICRRLRDSGLKVIATSSSSTTLEKFPNNPDNHDISVEAVNVGDYGSCEELAARIKADYGSVSVLVNNAGITKDGTFKKMTVEQWHDVINVNLNSLFNVTRQFINEMIEQKWGRIVNISSINGQKGQFGQTNYSASKAGIHGFSMALAQEMASSGITVNTISPGYTATPMVTAIREDVLEKIVSGIPMKRLAKVEEIAAAVNYLVSDDAAFISGANLPINGVQFTSF